MNIIISAASAKPMYEQIEEGIKKAILDGEFKHSDMLPSVRQLAKDLNVSTITTKRAYIDLEYEGFVYTIAGKGTFVKTDKLAEIQDVRRTKMLEEYQKITEESMKMGVDKETLEEIIERVYGGNEHE